MMSCYVTRWRCVCCVCVVWEHVCDGRKGGVDVQMDKNMFVI